jgi:hypothetical protein
MNENSLKDEDNTFRIGIEGIKVLKIRRLKIFGMQFSSLQVLAMNSSLILWCDDFTYLSEIIKNKLKMK